MQTLRLTSDRPCYDFDTDLDGASYRVTMTWREAIGGWYLDLRTANGVPIVLGQRVSPGGELIPDPTIPGAPRGRLYVNGPDPYERGDLGVSVTIEYVTAAEVAAVLG